MVHILVQESKEVGLCVLQNLFLVHDLPVDHDGLGGEEVGEVQAKLGEVEPDQFPYRIGGTNSVES